MKKIKRNIHKEKKLFSADRNLNILQTFRFIHSKITVSIAIFILVIVVGIGTIHPALASSSLKVDDITFKVTVKGPKNTGEVFYQVNKDTSTIKRLHPETTVTETYPAGTFMEVEVTPTPTFGQIDYIKVDGYLYYLDDARGDLHKSWAIEIIDIPGSPHKLTRCHEIEVGFMRLNTIDDFPEDLSMQAGEAYQVTPSPRYGTWSQDNQLYKVFDLREDSGSEGVWIQALAPTESDVTTPEKDKTYIIFNSTDDYTTEKKMWLRATEGTPRVYNIFTLAGVGGRFSVTGNNHKVNEGESKSFTIIPNIGYRIKNVNVDEVPLNLSDNDKRYYEYTFSNVAKHHNIVATFERVNEITLPTENFVTYEDDSVTWRVSPNDGYWSYDDEHVDNKRVYKDGEWVFDVAFKKAGNTKMIYNVDGKTQEMDITIHPTHTIAASAGLGGTISPKDNVRVKDKHDQTFTVEPDVGYITSKVLVDNQRVQLQDGKYTFKSVTNPHSINATFKEIKGLEDKNIVFGESVSMTPNLPGGTWRVADENILSITKNGDMATFKGLKAGKTKVAYAVKDGIREVTITVSTASNTWKVGPSIKGWTYGGTANQPLATSKYGKVDITYSQSRQGGFTANKPEKAGIWFMKASVTATGNYTGLNEIVEFEIKKATPPSIHLPMNLSGVYHNQLSSIGLKNGWYWVDGNQVLDTNTTHYLARLDVDDQNYDYSHIEGYNSHGYIERSLPVSVTPATNIWINRPKIDDWLYGETESRPTASAQYGTDQIKYMYSHSDQGPFTKEVPTNTGVWYMKASIPATEQYTELEEIVRFEIKKITPPSIHLPMDLSGVYHNKLSSINLENGWEWVNENQLIDTNTTHYLARLGVNDQHYDYRHIEGYDGNGHIVRKLQVSVTPAINTWINHPKIDNWIYGEIASHPTASAQYGTDQIKYMYSNSHQGTFTDEVPTNAGTWFMKAIIAETKEYTGLESIQEFTIAPMSIANNENITISQIKNEEDVKNLVVKDKDKELIRGQDYDVTVKHSEDIGVVTITFKGNYVGTIIRSYGKPVVEMGDGTNIGFFIMLSLLSAGYLAWNTGKNDKHKRKQR